MGHHHLELLKMIIFSGREGLLAIQGSIVHGEMLRDIELQLGTLPVAWEILSGHLAGFVSEFHCARPDSSRKAYGLRPCGWLVGSKLAAWRAWRVPSMHQFRGS